MREAISLTITTRGHHHARQVGADAEGPKGSRQTDADGKPVTEGWNPPRSTEKAKRVTPREVEQFQVGDRLRGRRV